MDPNFPLINWDPLDPWEMPADCPEIYGSQFPSQKLGALHLHGDNAPLHTDLEILLSHAEIGIP